MSKNNLAEEQLGSTLTGSRYRFARILCPLDLSPASHQGLWYGVGLALAFDAELIIFHSVQGHLQRSSENFQHAMQKTLVQQLSPDRLADLDWRCAAAEGNAAKSILNEAVAQKADLIIMHSRRRPAISGLLGATAEEVSRSACCPVLVTHSREQEWVDFSNYNVHIKRLLVGYDYSPYSEIALAYATSLAQEFQSELHLMHVLPKPSDTEQPLSSSILVKDAEQQLRDLLNPEVFFWCDVQYVVKEGDPYCEILNYAKNSGIDLICLGGHGRGFGEWSLFGSNTDRVLRQAPCPVFVARPLSYS